MSKFQKWIIGLLVGNLMLGIGATWWSYKNLDEICRKITKIYHNHCGFIV